MEFGYTKEEIRLFKKLNTPQKIQDYLNSLFFNFDETWGSCMSPRMVIKNSKADCIEGAIFAAAVLEFHGQKPLVVDLRSIKKPYDYDHVVAVFQKGGFWGAISKTNHSVLRYREPIYRDIRELVMSYFHEYFLDSGVKTLRDYSDPFDLRYFDDLDWRVTEKNLTQIIDKLDKIKHHKMLNKSQEKNLRKADKIEIESTKKREYEKTKRRG
jgi:hypothetical protein